MANRAFRPFATTSRRRLRAVGLVGALALAFALPSATSAAATVGAAAVSAGGNHSCGLRTDGTVACWGSNDIGQASPPSGTFSAVSAGGAHSCGVKTDGTLACWGDDGNGQASPPAGTFSAVSAGLFHSCGVKTGGTLACWGANFDAQASPPVGTFTMVSAGGSHSCGVKTDGTLACWGANGDNQASPPSGTFSAVSAGESHTCGVKTDGTLACWGFNGDGQASPPTGTFSAVSAGALHSCGVRSDGTLACWGFDDNGQASPPAGTFSVVSAGGLHSCGVKTDGTLTCWGNNNDGQLGAAPATPSPGPSSPALVGVLYSHTFSSNRGSPAGSFTVTAGNLPAGLTLSTAGVLAGTPTAVGTFSFTVTASNGLFPDASATFSLTINDTTPPSITPNVSGTPGANGWYTSNVSVTWTVAEPESPSALVTSGCAPTTIASDTAGTTVTCQATSSGGTNSASVTIKRDATPPTITCQSPPPTFALHASVATVSATLSDQSPGSGASSLLPASPQAADTTSAGAKTVSYRGTDNAGNSSGPVACAYSVIASAPLTPAPKCVVPKMVGKTLAAAKLALKQRHCRIGRVSYAHSNKIKKGRVSSQSRRVGQVLAANTKVNVVVSRGRKR